MQRKQGKMSMRAKIIAGMSLIGLIGVTVTWCGKGHEKACELFVWPVIDNRINSVMGLTRRQTSQMYLYFEMKALSGPPEDARLWKKCGEIIDRRSEIKSDKNY